MRYLTKIQKTIWSDISFHHICLIFQNEFWAETFASSNFHIVVEVVLFEDGREMYMTALKQNEKACTYSLASLLHLGCTSHLYSCLKFAVPELEKLALEE